MYPLLVGLQLSQICVALFAFLGGFFMVYRIIQ
jgi:hypothetical protein